MKSIKLFTIGIVSLLTVISSCKKDKPDPVNTNNNETTSHSLICEITAPDNITEVAKGTSITIKINVIDTIYQLGDVILYKDNHLLETMTSEPFQFDWNTTYEDTMSYIIKAIAFNSVGESDTDQVVIKLIEGNFGIQGNGVTDIDNNHYRTVIIGQQEWMAENLKTTHYPNGDQITNVSGDDNWKNLSYNDDAYSWYNDNVYYKDTYGAIYNWVAAIGDTTVGSNLNPSEIQGVCPDGWHLPSQEEWNELSNELGGGITAKMKMKEIGTTHWNNPNTGATNESGFWALPSGYRSSVYGNSVSMGNSCYLWSSTNNYYFYLTNDNSEVYLTGENQYGFAVRCVKD